MGILTAEKKFFLSLDQQQKRALFADFCRLEIETGGPDPHIDTACRNANGLARGLAAWLCFCYLIPYTGAGGAALWGKYPNPGEALGITEEWLVRSWGGIPSRDERKTVWVKRNFVTCVRGCADFILLGGLDRLYQTESYEEAWQMVQQVPHFGRYATIKYLEALHRWADFPHQMPDIRPKGAWSPRRSLWELTGIPEDSPEKEVNRLAARYKDELERELGFALTYFQFETLLCNLRQAISGRYAGRSHDSELRYWKKAAAFWQQQGRGGDWQGDWLFYENRAALYDHRLLGEWMGWVGPRAACSETLVKYGYLWQDLRFCFQHTTDFAKPVRWGEHECAFTN